MARLRYVPKTYNNRRLLRIIAGAAITLALAFLILVLILYLVLQAYVDEQGELRISWLPEDDGYVPSTSVQPVQTPFYTPAPPDTPEPLNPDDGDSDNTDPDSDDYDPDLPADIPEIYTIEQIQEALKPQFAAGAYSERNPQVVAIERAQRDMDSIRPESMGPDAPLIDLTNSLRFRVDFRFEQDEIEYNIWLQIYPSVDARHFRRDDDNHTIITEYYYFNDEDGVPVLAFIK